MSDTYDHVIAGAGSAGCVLGARLCEDPTVSVCLIEAGPADTSQNSHVPAAFGTHDEPDLTRGRISLPRGRVLGGTSSINTMIHIRGNRLGFDARRLHREGRRRVRRPDGRPSGRTRAPRSPVPCATSVSPATAWASDPDGRPDRSARRRK